MTTTPTTPTIRALLAAELTTWCAVPPVTEIKDIRVARDGTRDLIFRGALIGKGTTGSGGSSGYECDWTRGCIVRIYITTGGRIVTSVHRWSRWQGEAGRHDAAAHETPESALEWLREDNGGQLGAASIEAWEQTCSRLDALASYECESVE